MNKNRKSMIRFIVVIIVSAFIGGVVGGTIRAFELDISSFEFFTKVFPMVVSTVLAIISLVLVIICLVTYFKGKKFSLLVNDEDEHNFKEADRYLGLAVSYSALAQVVSVILLAPMMQYTFRDSVHADGMSNINIALVFLFIAIVIFNLFTLTVISVKATKTIQKIYPEKKGYALDKSFEKEWYNSCDEAEKEIIGSGSYAAYRMANRLFPMFILAGLLIAAVCENGYIFVLLQGGMWLVLAITYFKEVYKLEHKK